MESMFYTIVRAITRWITGSNGVFTGKYAFTELAEYMDVFERVEDCVNILVFGIIGICIVCGTAFLCMITDRKTSNKFVSQKVESDK